MRLTWPEAGGMWQAPALCGAACALCSTAPSTWKGAVLGFCFSIAGLGLSSPFLAILNIVIVSQQSSMS